MEESGTEEIFEENLPENFLKLTKDIKPHIQEVLISQEQYIKGKVYQEHHNKSVENQRQKENLRSREKKDI